MPRSIAIALTTSAALLVSATILPSCGKKACSPCEIGSPYGGNSDGGNDGGVDGGCSPCRLPLPSPGQVRRENTSAGTADWAIAKNGGGDLHHVEGYALSTTVRPGEDVIIAASSDAAPATLTWDVFRLGYYQNSGARKIFSGGPAVLGAQALCPMVPSTGLVACGWSESFRIHTQSDWIDGVYLVKMTRNDGYQSYVPFFVRDDSRASTVVVGIPTATWAAYNSWGGDSLYDGAANSRGRAYQVSYDKPYRRDKGAGHLIRNERHLIKWVEAQGLDITYATDEELDRDPNILSNAKILILPAHDEYWSSQIRSRVEAAVASGTSLALLGANAGYWQMRLDNASDGRTRRVITCYKGDALTVDPVGPQSPLLTGQFRLAPVSRPENALFGVMFNHHYNQFGFPTVITDVSHWAMQATGFAVGDTLPRAGGYEIDELVSGPSSPNNLHVLADIPMLSLEGAVGHGQMVIRDQGSATVFASGGIDFASTLASENSADPRAQRLVANIIYHALGEATPDLTVIQPSVTPLIQPGFAASVKTKAGVAGTPGDQDGVLGVGSFAAPIAVAPLPGGALAVADATVNKVKRIDAGGTITTLASGFGAGALIGIATDDAGNIYVSDSTNLCIYRIATANNQVSVIAGAPGLLGSADGPGSSARFSTLAGLSLSFDHHSLLVADLGNGTIRQINLSNPGYSVTTISPARLYRPSAVAQGADGTIYIVETGSFDIFALQKGVLHRLAGGGQPGYTDGPAASANFLPYLGIAVLADGSVVVSDPGNYRLRRISTAGTVTTYAGSGKFGHREGAADQSDLVAPAGLVFANNILYVADTGNGAIRQVQ